MSMDQDKFKIVVNKVSKVYKMYNCPMDKMKEAFSKKEKILHTDFHALSDLSFKVKEGEILGIMGRNGAGKSTLLKIITGILEPTQGNVKVEGRISSLLELGTGFNLEYTGIENIYFYGTLMGMTKMQMDAKINEIIDFAEIGDYVQQPVKTYSSGMFARLAFSCAINVDPDILIVDEILSVGDMRFQAKCFNKFREFKEKGVTILYVGHDVGMMRTFCDSAMWLNNGKLIDYGDPTYICAAYTEFMYLDDISEFTSYKKFQEKEEIKTKVEEVKGTPIKENALINNKDSLFKDSIAHWGTNVGSIKKISMLDSTGKEKNYFEPNEIIILEIEFETRKDFDYKFLSVAVSIKNKEGTDLIVKTTFDENIFLVKQKDKLQHKVRFSFKTLLAKGEYYIVVALENRKNASITYFEYIEGAKYFKIYTNKKIFGIIDVEAEIVIE